MSRRPLRAPFVFIPLLASTACAHPWPPALPPAPSPPAEDLTRFVDPFIGTRGGGNVLPGPALPFGMVKPGPDTDARNANAGYTSDGPILGFSHLHVSGTGGGPKYGVILAVPQTGELLTTGYGSPRADEAAGVGWYKVRLVRPQVDVELAATAHAAYHRYVFPAGRDAHLLFDLTHVLTSVYAGESQRHEESAITLATPQSLGGQGRYAGGWNKGGPYTVFFCARASQPGRVTRTANGAAWSWPAGTAPRTIDVRVGLSFLDLTTACAHVDREIPRFDLPAVRARAVAAWNDLLGHVRVAGGNEERKRIFYTALYHAHMQPTDRTGENPKWRSSEPAYDDFYAVWDTYRTVHPLLTLIEPERQRDIVRAMVDIYRHDGYLPEGRSGNDNGRTQGGSNADVVLADAFVKGLPGIDWKAAFQAMLKDAEVPPPDAQKEGRGGLDDFRTLGYVSTVHERAGTRTLEYSLCDFALAEVARGLGRTADAERYRRRATNWANLWNPALAAEGVQGFIAPRTPDGAWQEGFSVKKGGSWPDFFYESDSWEYSLAVPHDVRGLVERSGGAEAFLRRLDRLFDGRHWNIGNEPAFFAPVLYHWVGRPDRSVDRARAALDRHFRATPDGIPGNDDSGALSAWYVFHALGFYPNAGSDVYLLTSPLFDRVTVALGGGPRLDIVADGASGANRYVQAATLNGRPLERAWFRHGEIAKGGRLVLTMGPTPGAWGHSPPPPSLSDP